MAIGKDILVVDDMPDHIAYSGNLLRSEGYRVFAASSGKAALRFLERRIPDLILLDIQMDDINGLDLCKTIKDDPKTAEIPVIFLTSETIPAVISKSFELGGCDYVKKPFIKEEYLARIKTHLEVSMQRKELTAANEELTQFCSAVSHDLKAPFNIINMLIDMLRQEIGDEPGQSIAEIMEMIVAKSTQTKLMIERLFEFSKMCNIKPNMTQTDIKPIVEEIYGDLIKLEGERKIIFKCGQLPPVNCDEMLVRIMMKNLLANAIKYTSKRKVAEIEISGESGPEYNIIKIKDNGAGFDMAYEKKLFQVFQRLHTDEEFEGSGVGLALINRIMKRHGGAVKAYGEVDKGAEFSLLFPKR